MSVSPAAAGPIRVERRSPEQIVVPVAVVLCGLVMVAAGIFALGWPTTFAEFVRFDPNEHFLHDAGAFQIGIGIGLLLALVWRDALLTTLAAFWVANTVHAYNHVADLHLGGRLSDPWLLGTLSALATLAVWARLRALGYVVGYVRPAMTRALAPFAEQKTVVLTTYRANGTPVPTAVSVAIDGDRAVVRSFQKAGKTRRLRKNPTVEIAPSTGRGVPTGPAIRATARILDGAESRRAAHLLRRKYPLLHGLVVPLSHRAGRAKLGRTVHFELTPVDAA